MQLTKQNIIPISIIQTVLTTNFTKIEEEFKKINRQILSLKQNSRNIVEKLNGLDPDDYMEYYEKCQDSEEEQATDNKIEGKEEGFGNYNSVNDGNNQQIKPITESQSPLENKNASLVRSKGKNSSNSQSKQSQSTLNKKQSNNTQQNQGHQPSNRKNMSQQAMIKEFIRNLQLRVTELEKNRQRSDGKIADLEKDNETFKKMLKYRQSGRKTRRQSQMTNIVNDHLNKKQDRKSKLELQPELVQNKIVEQNQTDEPLEQNNIMVTFNKELEEVKEYVRSKVTSIETNLTKFLTDLEESKQQIATLHTQNNENRKNLENLEYHCKQNLINIPSQRLNSKLKTPLAETRTSLFNNTNHRIKTSNQDINNLNDTIESYKTYYEDKIVEIFEEMDKIRNEYYAILEKMGKEGQGENEQERLKNLAIKISSIQSPNEEKLKKQVSSLKKDHKRLRQELNELIGNVNVGTNETRTLIIKPNENKEDWKNLTLKINRLRQQLMSYVKQLENKITTNNETTTILQQLQVGLSQCKLLNGKKVNITDFQKSMKRVENRLNNFIKQVCQKEGMLEDQDASIVRQPWFCLSCDNEIKNYTGKMGKSIYNQKLPGKKVNPQSHMIRRPSPGKLPSVH